MPRPVEVLQKAHIEKSLTTASGATVTLTGVTMTLTGVVSHGSSYNNSSIANLTALVATGASSLGGRLNVSTTAHFGGAFTTSGVVTCNSGMTVLGISSHAGVIDCRTTLRLSGAPPMVQGQSLSTQWAGYVTVASGIAAGTMSTTVVKSDSLIFSSIFSNTASNNGNRIVIHSKTDGAYFGFTVEPTPVGTDFTVGFLIVNVTSL